MVKHYWERHGDYQDAINAALEALREAEIAESTYYGVISRQYDPKAYIMEQRQRSAAHQKRRLRASIQTAMEHLNGAMNAWGLND